MASLVERFLVRLDNLLESRARAHLLGAWPSRRERTTRKVHGRWGHMGAAICIFRYRSPNYSGQVLLGEDVGRLVRKWLQDPGHSAVGGELESRGLIVPTHRLGFGSQALLRMTFNPSLQRTCTSFAGWFAEFKSSQPYSLSLQVQDACVTSSCSLGRCVAMTRVRLINPGTRCARSGLLGVYQLFFFGAGWKLSTCSNGAAASFATVVGFADSGLTSASL